MKVLIPRDAAADADEILANCIAMFEHCGYYEITADGQAEWQVYFEPGSVPEDFSGRVADMAAELGLPGISISGPSAAPKENWHDAWRAYFKPVALTDRMLIVPAWEEKIAADAERDGKLVLRIEPGMAFGTGTHATTQLCLKAAEQLVQPGCAVLDAGTGSAILAIAAVKLGAARVVAFDLDTDVEENARFNANLNGVPADAIELLIQSLDRVPAELFEVIFCNMLSKEFLPLLAPLSKYLRPETGRIVISGLLTTEREEILLALDQPDVLLRPISTDEQGEWTLIIASREK